MAKDAASFVKPYLVKDGRKFRLKDHDPGDTGRMQKERAKKALGDGVSKLCDLQERLYAQDKWGVLLIFQAMDAAGKDGAIKHVMSGINPQGCQVFSFKAPSDEDRDHDFLWRTSKSLPERGRIGIFNRSYYEEVLVVRVHPQILAGQKLPEQVVSKKIWADRCADIAAFEQYLARNGYVVLKFFLNVSRKEQRDRFLERLTMPEKNWKFSLGDAKEREYLGRLHGGLRGRHPTHRHSGGAVGGRARRQQMVRAARRRRRRRFGARRARPAVPDGRCGQED